MRYLIASLLCVFTLSLTAQGPDEYWVGLEEYAVHTEGELSGMTTWRMYIHMQHTDDYLSACTGSENYPWIMESTSSPAWYQHPDASETFANAINPSFYTTFPDLEYDSWLTLGVENSIDPMEILALTDPTYNAFAAFEAGENVMSNTAVGNGWVTLFPGLGADNAGFAGDDLKVLIGQLTTSGTISGTIYFNIFPMGIQSPDLRILRPILYAPTQCMDTEACNYDESAWTNDDCTYIGAEACDCDGNVLDECGECGGYGIADGDCDCEGNILDECGVCNGPGTIYECGCYDIPEGDCDCFGNVIDACGGCGGESGCLFCDEGTYWNVDTQTCLVDDTYCSWQPDSNADGNIGIGDLLDLLSVFGDTDYDEDGVFDSVDDCVDPTACNYQSNPTEPCYYMDVLGVCGGGCEADEDDDSICDDIDDCIGVVDECGVCNGPGPTEIVIESITILYDSVYAEAIDNWFVFEIGADTVFNYFCEPVFPPLTDENIHEAVDLWLFDEASAVATYGHISDWDVSSVTNMAYLFYYASNFNSDISSWDVSSVTALRFMFYGAYSFNGDLSSWDVSSVTYMNEMFRGASSFNSDLSSWDVSSVTDMEVMFYNANSFNADLSSWDVSSVTDMEYMFFGASSFNSDISSWDVSSVLNMGGMLNNTALSEENKCLIHTSFSSYAVWPYDWSGFCPAVFNSCGDDIGHDGYDYSTVQIGEQCWFSENCRYLPEVSPSNEGSETDPYYYVYDYEGTDVTAAQATTNYATYGVLYNWLAVMTEGICPSGWHIPTDGEWQTMEISLGMFESDAAQNGFRGSPVGDYMKSTSGWNSGGDNGSNSSGFTGLPGGSSYSGGFNYNGNLGQWWSASESGWNPWARQLSYYDDNVPRFTNSRDYGYSARCVRD